jgi:hypothetical protein
VMEAHLVFERVKILAKRQADGHKILKSEFFSIPTASMMPTRIF